MILTEIMKRNTIKAPLNSTNKNDAIEELVDLLLANNMITNKNSALDAVMERENSRSTGIGYGIAIPHAKSDAAKSLVMALGITKEPIEFQSLDNKPVNIIFLLIASPQNASQHVMALAQISKLMIDEDFRNKLQSCQNAEEAYDLFVKYENT